MVTALIFAGGTGQRMNSKAKPKQFLDLHGKPILLYTLEHFEQHPEVDQIIIVCLQDWISELDKDLKRYGYNKVTAIVPGGTTGHDSIYNGLKAMEAFCAPDDLVLIHDGVRPLINGELISQNILVAREFGTAVTVSPTTESVVVIPEGDTISSVPERGKMFLAKAPQTFRYGLIWEYYQRAHEVGMTTIDSSHLLSIFNVEMHTVVGTQSNIKITSPSDYYIFRALYEAMENQQIWGI